MTTVLGTGTNANHQHGTTTRVVDDMSSLGNTHDSSVEHHKVLVMMADKELKRRDLEKIRGYVKEDAFYSSIFAYDSAMNEEKGGKYYREFLKKGRKMLADGRLEDIKEKIGDIYLDHIWREAKSRNVYRDAMASKRSNVYQVVHGKFDGKCQSVGGKSAG